MPRYVALLFAVFILSLGNCLCEQAPICQPLCAEWYRPGHWWPVYVDLPVDFPGSAQTFAITLGRHTVELCAADAGQAQRWTYLLPDRMANALLCDVRAASGAPRFAQQRELALRPLPERQMLVGLLGWTPTPTGLTGHAAVVVVKHVPDRSEGMAMFDQVWLGTGELAEVERQVLCQWVARGGRLVLAPAVLSYWRDVLAALPRLAVDHTKHSWRGWQLGCGDIYCADDANPPPTLLGFRRANRLRVAEDRLAGELATSLPATWNERTLSWLWLLCTGHALLVMTGIWLGRKKGSWLVAGLILFTAADSLLVWHWLFTYCGTAQMRQLCLRQHIAGWPWMCQVEQTHLRHLRQPCQPLRFASPALPTASLPGTHLTLLAGDGTFAVHLPAVTRHVITSWRSEKWEMTTGDMQAYADDGQIKIANASTTAWRYCLYVDRHGFLAVGHLYPGRALLLGTQARRLPVDGNSLPYPWRGRTWLLPWLTQIGTPVLVGEADVEITSALQLASPEKICVVWMQLPEPRQNND